VRARSWDEYSAIVVVQAHAERFRCRPTVSHSVLSRRSVREAREQGRAQRSRRPLIRYSTARSKRWRVLETNRSTCVTRADRIGVPAACSPVPDTSTEPPSPPASSGGRDAPQPADQSAVRRGTVLRKSYLACEIFRGRAELRVEEEASIFWSWFRQIRSERQWRDAAVTDPSTRAVRVLPDRWLTP
jgi:hypothetical protein